MPKPTTIADMEIDYKKLVAESTKLLNRSANPRLLTNKRRALIRKSEEYRKKANKKLERINFRKSQLKAKKSTKKSR